jgi:nucleoside-diphosphate-sugar epimerase
VRTIVLSGATTDLGRRVAALAAETRPAGAGAAESPAATVLALEAASERLKAQVEGAEALVHLGGSVDDARRMLDAAAAASIPHVVLLSSATVYGAWPNNPLPLTEDAPLRPNPGFAVAVEAGEVERIAAEWQDDHPGTTVAVLRPTVAVAEDSPSWLARGLRAAGALRGADEAPPAQFIHLDDLAAAVDLAWRARLDGPRNVAPDGWIAGEDVRALAGVPAVRLPERLATRLSILRWRLHLAPTPPELLPYAMHPWVVANDRLRADGWRPAYTNEEAFVAGHRPGPLATISPRRKQELALGISGVALAGIAAGAIAVVRRWLRAPKSP